MPSTSGAEDQDQMREARAYNNSIYLMVGMPYLLLGGVGYAVRRALRRHAAAAPAGDPRYGSGTSANENVNGTSTSDAGVR